MKPIFGLEFGFVFLYMVLQPHTNGEYATNL